MQTVSDYVKENWPDKELISDEELLSKLIILSAITIESKASDIQHLNWKILA